MKKTSFLGTFVAIAFALTIGSSIPVHLEVLRSDSSALQLAQTQGSDRRQDRRNDRQDDRTDRQGDRQDCRQAEGVGKDKRDCKQDGRKDRNQDG